MSKKLKNSPANAGLVTEPGGFGRTLEKILNGRPGLSKLWLAKAAGITIEELEKLILESKTRYLSHMSHDS